MKIFNFRKCIYSTFGSYDEELCIGVKMSQMLFIYLQFSQRYGNGLFRMQKG